MGRAPCCDKSKVKKGPWSPQEDTILKNYIHNHGIGGNWIALPHKAGLKRCGKSCRLRWLNYLRPDIKLGGFTEEEDNIILTLYINIGSRWSVIASHLEGRTDNDVKNHWNTKLKKKLSSATTTTSTTVIHPTHFSSITTPPFVPNDKKDENFNRFTDCSTLLEYQQTLMFPSSIDSTIHNFDSTNALSFQVNQDLYSITFSMENENAFGSGGGGGGGMGSGGDLFIEEFDCRPVIGENSSINYSSHELYYDGVIN